MTNLKQAVGLNHEEHEGHEERREEEIFVNFVFFVVQQELRHRVHREPGPGLLESAYEQ